MERGLSTLDFNKEIIFGEIGALIAIPIMAYLASKVTDSAFILSALAVAGSIIGASAFWIFMRVYDEKKVHIFSMHHLVKDIEYFTPAAFLLTVLVYYPIIFFFSEYLLNRSYYAVYSVVISQAIAFTLFLAAINLYRYSLWKITGEKL